MNRLSPRRFAAATAFAVAAAMPASAFAQDASDSLRFSIEGDVRVRGEALDGQFRASGLEEDSFVSTRTRVKAELAAGPVRLVGELRDGRSLYMPDGDTAALSTSSVNTIEPLQAYGAFDIAGVAGGTLTLSGGRFTQEIGSGRLVGIPGFSNSVVSYAGVRAEWEGAGDRKAIFFWTRPFDTLPSDDAALRDNEVELDRVSNTVTFFGGSVTTGVIAGATGEAYVYRFAENDSVARPTRDRKLVTVGGRFARDPEAGVVDFDFEAAGQFGSIRAGTAPTAGELDVEAAMLHAEAGYTFATGWSPRVAVAFDLATGDGADSSTYGRFDALYGTRRSDFGPTSIYGAVKGANIVSPGIRFDAEPNARLDMSLFVRGLWLESSTDAFVGAGVRDASGNSGSYAGTQAEARVRYWLVPGTLRLEAGGAYLAKGRFLEEAPNAPDTGDTRYGYLELSAKF
ncbi:alginate export family protein [Sphingosinithalassobacter sp. LHW66-3]|uniref:alginate export family protein n=1 Tax=Sphingosinithalassobacter sp. LHW66-3 TaxID=3424718 RepID=UPI003D6AAF3C